MIVSGLVGSKFEMFTALFCSWSRAIGTGSRAMATVELVELKAIVGHPAFPTQ